MLVHTNLNAFHPPIKWGGSCCVRTEYCKIFGHGKDRFVLEGELVEGLGEGCYYVNIPGYFHQFVEKLGFEPYPGTLNLKLRPPYVQMRKRLDALPWIAIDEFSADGRTFGSARCLLCTIENHPCAIIVPGRTHYPEDVVEILSPVQLRVALKIDAGDDVTVAINYD